MSEITATIMVYSVFGLPAETLSGTNLFINSLSLWGRIERNHVARRMGQGKAMSPMSRSAREMTVRAALSASMKNGIGHVFLSVSRERMNPGQMTETLTPSFLRKPRRESPHVFMQLLVAE